MITRTINSIAIALSATFPGVTIYADKVPQQHAEPSFYIKDLTASQSGILGSRYMRRQSFAVHYYPQNKTAPRAEIHGVAEELMDVLEYVGDGELIVRGTGMSYEITDDVLVIMVDYNMPVIKQEAPGSLMESLEYDDGIPDHVRR